MGKVDVSVEDNALKVSVDTNEDGEAVATAKIHLTEAIQEAFKKGETVVIEGTKKVAFSFGLTGLKVKIDSDQDGEPVAELDINLPEALDESGLADKLG